MAKAYVNKRDKFLWDNSFKPESTNEVPVPTVSDEGKAIVVNENGSYTLGNVSKEDEIVRFEVNSSNELVDATSYDVRDAILAGKTVILEGPDTVPLPGIRTELHLVWFAATAYAVFCGVNTQTVNSNAIYKIQVPLTSDTANVNVSYNVMYEPYYFDTVERVVGRWIDGSDVYQKTIYYDGTMSTNITIPHNITNFDRLIKVEGVIHRNNVSNYKPLFDPALTNGGIKFAPDYSCSISGVSSSNIDVSIGNGIVSGVNNLHVTLWYTKTTD